MGYKTLDLTLISARGLKKVNLIGKMDVYVVVSLSGDPRNSKQKTPVHKDGGSSPHWNYTVRFTVDESLLAGLTVVFRLKHERTFRRDNDVGEVGVPVKDMLDKKDQPQSTFTYQVRRPSGRLQGQFQFSYKLTDWIPPPPPPPVTALPPQPSRRAAAAVYPPPPQQASYPYGGHRQHHHHHHHHNGGDGIGMGFLGGVLGGLLVEEIFN